MDSKEFDSLSKEEQKKVKWKDLPKRNRRTALFLGIAVAVPLLIIFLRPKDEKAEAEAMKKENAQHAYIISQHYVKQGLKAPATANFPTLDYRAVQLQDSSWIVTGYVDAQNSLGAKIRSNYSVVMKQVDEDWAEPGNWRASELKITGN